VSLTEGGYGSTAVGKSGGESLEAKIASASLALPSSNGEKSVAKGTLMGKAGIASKKEKLKKPKVFVIRLFGEITIYHPNQPISSGRIA